MLLALPRPPSEQLQLKFPVFFLSRKRLLALLSCSELLSCRMGCSELSAPHDHPSGNSIHPKGWRQCVRTCGKIPQSFQLTLQLLKGKSGESVRGALENATDKDLFGAIPTFSHEKASSKYQGLGLDLQFSSLWGLGAWNNLLASCTVQEGPKLQQQEAPGSCWR